MTVTPTQPTAGVLHAATGSDPGRRPRSQPDLRRLGFGPDAVPYLEAWDEQRRVHAGVVDGSLPDTVLLLEHPPTYTAGKRTRPSDRPSDGTPVVDVDRDRVALGHGRVGNLPGQTRCQSWVVER